MYGLKTKYGEIEYEKSYGKYGEIESLLPVDVKAHIARVTADGGTVPEQAKMVSMVKKLIAANLWDNCVFFGLPLGGVKKDGNQFVSKVYDLKNNADLLQATGTSQPKYDNGNILYDGGDKIQSDSILVSNQISQCVNAITVICWVNVNNIGFQFFIDRYGAMPVWLIVQRANGVMGVVLIKTGGASFKDYSTTDVIGDGWKCLAFTYSVTNGLLLYINGVEKTVTKNKDNQNAALSQTTEPITIGQRGNSSSNAVLNGNQTALHQIYNTTFTPEQILWNYNNIRPEGV